MTDDFKNICTLEIVPASKLLTVDNSETYELKYFPLNSLPPIYYQQHRDFIEVMKLGNIPGFR